MTTATSTVATPAPLRTGTRVMGIDGLRAAAALWVVVFHMGAFSGGDLWPGVDYVVSTGAAGVSLFLVLSGLCLYLPFAGGRSSRFRADTFFRRRIRRLLPAYYVTLAIVVVTHLVAAKPLGLDQFSPGETAWQATTHMTLTHQLFPETFYALNGAYWSLGLEWELYLTLPILIAAAAKFGLKPVVITVFVVTASYRMALFFAVQQGLLAPDSPWGTVVLPNQFLGRWSEFALGMVAAEWFRTRGTRVSPALAITAVVSAVLAVTLPDNPLNHILYGVVFFTLVALVLAGDNVISRVFSWRPLVAIGVMSYSLYLVHQPMVEVFGHLLGAGRGNDPRTVFLQMLLLFPVILLTAWILFVTVERRSLAPKGVPVLGIRESLFPKRDKGTPDTAVSTVESRQPSASSGAIG